MQENKNININFFNLNCLVIGDIFIDVYSEYESNRLSPEAIIPVLKESKKKYKLGGAGNVAKNLISLGISVDLISFVGKDKLANKLTKLLNNQGIKHNLIKLNSFKTITKERLVANNNYIARIDDENILEKNYYKKIENCNFFKSKKKYNYIILSDYGKGSLNQVDKIIKFLKRKFKNIPIFVDPKGKNFFKYSNVDYLTPNEKEFREAIFNFNNDNIFASTALNFLSKAKINNLLVTRGSYGLTFFSKNKQTNFPLENKIQVYDVTGAGDTAISVFSSCIASKNSFVDASKLTNLAASSVVKMKGTSAITYLDLINILADNYSYEYKKLELNQLKLIISQLKKENKTIGFTNGCFDILHPGHFDLLNKCKKKCDKLILGLNSDSSIKKIKGADRPYNDINKRLLQVCSLKSVDYVFIFNERTPIKVINIIKPDYLFKGYDYRNKEVVGKKIIDKYNGKVEIIPKRFNTSTSKILAKK